MEEVDFEEAFRQRYGVAPKLDGMLLMIGVDVLGYWPEGAEKVIKQDLIMLGVWRLLEWRSYAVRQGTDAEGWPQYELIQPLPYQDSEEETDFLERTARAYFAEIWQNLERARPRDH
jgi:hypothetical protein